MSIELHTIDHGSGETVTVVRPCHQCDSVAVGPPGSVRKCRGEVRHSVRIPVDTPQSHYVRAGIEERRRYLDTVLAATTAVDHASTDGGPAPLNVTTPPVNLTADPASVTADPLRLTPAPLPDGADTPLCPRCGAEAVQTPRATMWRCDSCGIVPTATITTQIKKAREDHAARAERVRAQRQPAPTYESALRATLPLEDSRGKLAGMLHRSLDAIAAPVAPQYEAQRDGLTATLRSLIARTNAAESMDQLKIIYTIWTEKSTEHAAIARAAGYRMQAQQRPIEQPMHPELDPPHAAETEKPAIAKSTREIMTDTLGWRGLAFWVAGVTVSETLNDVRNRTHRNTEHEEPSDETAGELDYPDYNVIPY